MYRLNLFFVCLAAALAQSSCKAFAQERLPFPNLSFRLHCEAVVSKMLDPDEKKKKLADCIANEVRLKAGLEPYWKLMPPLQQKQVLSHFTSKDRETYTTVFQYASHWIAAACLTGAITCSRP